MTKIDLTVNARHHNDGRITPISIVWSDGRVFEIDKVLDVRRAASIKVGGVGIGYRCKIRGKEVDVFDEEGKWFMEK